MKFLMSSALLCTLVALQFFFTPIHTHSVRKSTIRAAPYFMPFENDPQPIDEIIKDAGVKHFILAFVLATNKGECIPSWNGDIRLSVEEDTHVLNMIKDIRAAGGDVAISFGGYNGIELGIACKSAQELATAYQSVIDKYQITNIDFDIEGDALGKVDEENRRFEAINILRKNAQAKGHELFVTLTMPVTIVGLSELGRAEIQRAMDAQCEIDLYKIMAFDYGGTAEHEAEGIQIVMEQVHQQLKAIRTDLTDEQVYGATGMILMNGHTDQATELYTQKVFKDMVTYAEKHGLGRVSFWALNRDRECTKPVGWAAGFCSSVPQKPYEFSKIIADFNDYKPSEEVPTTTTTKVPITTLFPTTKALDHHPDNPPTSSPIDHHNFDCKIEVNTFHPYKDDCHQYVHCYEGLPHVELCPPGTIFDVNLHLCNFEAAVDRPECKK